MIGIIDYGSGNLRSVYNAFRYLAQECEIVEEPGKLACADKLVLPGVGSSRDAMEGLAKKDLIAPLVENISAGKPLLGICLGLQLLFTRSLEGGGCECLDIIRGEVKLFPGGEGMKVPQIGWNTVKLLREECPIFKGVKDESFFYFVHSYYCEEEKKEFTVGETGYGLPYTSAIWKDNIYAVQFHPERSQDDGMKILRNFAEL